MSMNMNNLTFLVGFALVAPNRAREFVYLMDDLTMDVVSSNNTPGRRVRFRQPEGLRVDERWEERTVRLPPCYPAWNGGPSRLAYHENYRAAVNFGRALQNSNLVQVILRDHGYDKIDTFDHAAWSIFWCSGPVAPEQLAALQPWQRVNKFPSTTALTSKLSLWTHFARMQNAHGNLAFGFMPDCFVLPGSLAGYEEHLGRRLEEGANDLWILKPDDENSRSKAKSNGIGIFLHRALPGSQWGSLWGGSSGGVVTDQVRRHEGVACR